MGLFKKEKVEDNIEVFDDGLEIQDTVNEDSIDILVEGGETENVQD